MAEKVCEMNMTVERGGTGYLASGHIKFHGSGHDKCMVVAHLLDAVEFPKGMPGMVLLAKAFRLFEDNTSDALESEAAKLIEEAEQWQ